MVITNACSRQEDFQKTSPFTNHTEHIVFLQFPLFFLLTFKFYLIIRILTIFREYSTILNPLNKCFLKTMEQVQVQVILASTEVDETFHITALDRQRSQGSIFRRGSGLYSLSFPSVFHFPVFSTFSNSWKLDFFIEFLTFVTKLFGETKSILHH